MAHRACCNALSALHAPYGTWRITQSYVPGAWAQGDGGLDWGLAFVAPNANGQYPGDLTGVHTAYVNADTPVGTHFWLAGYPVGDAFGSPQNHYGLGQYHCNHTWDGDALYASLGPRPAYLIGSGYYLAAIGCEMTGGASGGPVFQEFANGTWGITGVNNVGGTDPNTGLGAFLSWQWFNNDFSAFYCNVMPCARSARASRRRKRPPARPHTSCTRHCGRRLTENAVFTNIDPRAAHRQVQRKEVTNA